MDIKMISVLGVWNSHQKNIRLLVLFVPKDLQKGITEGWQNQIHLDLLLVVEDILSVNNSLTRNNNNFFFISTFLINLNLSASKEGRQWPLNYYESYYYCPLLRWDRIGKLKYIIVIN